MGQEQFHRDTMVGRPQLSHAQPCPPQGWPPMCEIMQDYQQEYQSRVFKVSVSPERLHSQTLTKHAAQSCCFISISQTGTLRFWEAKLLVEYLASSIDGFSKHRPFSEVLVEMKWSAEIKTLRAVWDRSHFSLSLRRSWLLPSPLNHHHHR